MCAWHVYQRFPLLGRELEEMVAVRAFSSVTFITFSKLRLCKMEKM